MIIMKHPLFVYGTLKRGFGNNYLLSSGLFLTEATTFRKFTLYSPSFPIAVGPKEDEWALPVRGEVWEVDDNTLSRVDRLEGHPNWYQRKQIKLTNNLTAWMYIQQDKQSLSKMPLANVVDGCYSWSYDHRR